MSRHWAFWPMTHSSILSYLCLILRLHFEQSSLQVNILTAAPALPDRPQFSFYLFHLLLCQDISVAHPEGHSTRSLNRSQSLSLRTFPHMDTPQIPSACHIVFTTQDISMHGHSTSSFDMSYSLPFRTFPCVATLRFLSACHCLYHSANMFCEFFKLHLSIFMAGDKLRATGPANQMQDSRSNPPAPEQNKPTLCFLFL